MQQSARSRTVDFKIKSPPVNKVYAGGEDNIIYVLVVKIQHISQESS